VRESAGDLLIALAAFVSILRDHHVKMPNSTAGAMLRLQRWVEVLAGQPESAS
jgi:hypothetical protein